MVEPNSKHTQSEYFVPQKTLAVFFGSTTYDQVYEKKVTRDREIVLQQCEDDLKEAKDDINVLKACLEKCGTEDFYILDEPSSKEASDVFEQIHKRVKAGKVGPNRVNYLIIYLFAGHGINKDGMQAFLLNEWYDKERYYTSFNAE